MKSKKHPYLDEELFYSDSMAQGDPGAHMEPMIDRVIESIFPDPYWKRFFADKKDLVCIDVGANVGVATGYLRRYCSIVYALEPSLRHFEALVKNKEVNGWNNVVPLNMAMFDRTGEMQLNIDDYVPTQDGLVWPTGKTQPVEVITLTDFLKRFNIPRVDFLKIDVEGSEYAIVACEDFAAIDTLDIEFHMSRQEKCLPKLYSIFRSTVVRAQNGPPAWLCSKVYNVE